VTLEQVMREMPRRLGRRTLSFDEVVASRRPAVFQEFGDWLLYLGGAVFILKDADPRAQPDAAPPVLEPQALVGAVGIESGWRHAAGCDCHVCAADADALAA
jgi:hypothetical protein